MRCSLGKVGGGVSPSSFLLPNLTVSTHTLYEDVQTWCLSSVTNFGGASSSTIIVVVMKMGRPPRGKLLVAGDISYQPHFQDGTRVLCSDKNVANLYCG